MPTRRRARAPRGLMLITYACLFSWDPEGAGYNSTRVTLNLRSDSILAANAPAGPPPTINAFPMDVSIFYLSRNPSDATSSRDCVHFSFNKLQFSLSLSRGSKLDAGVVSQRTM
mmetsp:Transcript_25633/g.34128  ORF Transcript_25633/g.34128 Transcript_25633/m.34128 type:complete len:114 (+) Transcript_25633:1542-1883(+)